MRRNVSIILVIFALIAVPVLAHYPGKIKIDAAAKKQPPVLFDHAKHGDTLAKSCDTCHHTQKGLTKAQVEKVDVKKCSECHLKAQGKMGTMADMIPAKNPMHVRCIGCDKEQKKGPTVCTKCHIK